MNNDETELGQEKVDGANKQEASFYRFVSVRNTVILFWTAFAFYLFYTSYVPPGMVEHRWMIILARTLFLATIGLWMLADGLAHKIEEKWLWYYFAGSIFFPLVAIALPIFMVHSRGWVGAAKSTLLFAGYSMLAFVLWYGLVGVLLMFGIHEVGTPTITF